ncbi:isochorismatase family cysteine hydrolase [Lentilactobacillus sp. Marseille-Q4993]|uniref:isochorismatase family cysteine hydrolase n=1 Tax=Lentilactobacillus sp. Marseille-Q4993 TaxID=3039492 RepID=UPI0024BC51E0|nr:isochorismatase family cysteine hydrolase [Lentilactobacillus sp. Marseille-Q4993]
MATALLVVDMTNDFITGKLKNDRALKVISPLKKLVDEAHKSSTPVVYISDAHYPEDTELKLWGEHSMKGEWGGQVVDELTPTDKDYTLEKRNYSAFFETGLDTLLRELNVDNVVVTGVVTNICIQHTSADAFFRGYSITVPKETTEALSDEEYASGLNFLKTMYGAKIVSVDDQLFE